MAEFSVKFKLTPTIDIPALNSKLDQIKNMLGSGLSDSFRPFQNVVAGLSGAFNTIQTNTNNMANGIRSSMAMLIVSGEKGSEQYKQLAQQLKIVEKEAASLGNAYEQVGTKAKTSFGSAAIAMNQALQFTTQISGQLNEAVMTSAKFEKELKGVGAFVGIQGDALKKMGESARELGVSFGDIGKAGDQLNIFKGVLSKLGPEYGKNNEAMALFARNINVLAKAGEIDVKTAMESMINSMLQFGMRTGDAARDAETSTKFVNGLAAAARAGAAEVNQVAEAMLQAGVMARSSGVSFEETAAAIETMAEGGKVGAEAGVALRNVLGLLQRPNAEAQAAFRQMGTTAAEVGDVLANQGLGSALKLLKTSFDSLPTSVERSNALMKIFGLENAAAAGIMMNNTSRYNEFLTQIKQGQEGVGIAFEMVAQKQGTAIGIVEKWKAKVEDFFIGAGDKIGVLGQSVLMATTKIAPAVTSMAMAWQVLPTEKIGKYIDTVGGVGGVFKQAGKSIVEFAKSQKDLVVDGAKNIGAYITKVGGIGPAFAAGATGLWSMVKAAAAFVATPLGAAITATVALGAGVAYLAGAFNQSAESKLADTEATIKYTKIMMAENQKQQNLAKQKLMLTAEYESVLRKSVVTQEEIVEKEKRLRDIRERLNAIVPETINLTKSHEENLQKLKETTHLLGIDTSKFTEDNQTLVTTFEQLAQKENKTEKEKQKLAEITQKLNVIFPEAQIGTRAFGDSMNYLKDRVGLGSKELSKLGNELSRYKDDLIELQKRQANDQFWANKNKLREKLGMFDKTVFWIETMSQAFAKATNLNELNQAYDRWSEMVKKNTDITGNSKTVMLEGLIQLRSDWANYLNKLAETGKENDKKIIKSGTEDLADVASTYQTYLDEISKGFQSANTDVEKRKFYKRMSEVLSNALNTDKITQEEFDELSAIAAEKANVKKKTQKIKVEKETAREVNRVIEEAERVKAQNADIIAKRELKSKQDSYDAQLAELNRANAKELEAIQKKITAQTEILKNSKGDDNKANQDLLDQLGTNLELTKEKHFQLVEDLTNKHLTSQQQAYKDAEQYKIDYDKKMLATLEAEGSSSLENLKQQLDLKTQIIEADNNKEIQSVLERNDSYKQAYGELINVLAKYGKDYVNLDINKALDNQNLYKSMTTADSANIKEDVQKLGELRQELQDLEDLKNQPELFKFDLWGVGIGDNPFAPAQNRIQELKAEIDRLSEAVSAPKTREYLEQLGNAFKKALANPTDVYSATDDLNKYFENITKSFQGVIPDSFIKEIESQFAPIVENADTIVGDSSHQIYLLNTSVMELLNTMQKGIKGLPPIIIKQDVQEAIENLRDVKDGIIRTDGLILNSRKKTNELLTNERIEFNFKEREIQAQSIRDEAEREFEIRKIYAERTFKGSITQSGKNLELQKQAFENYQKALYEIELDYQFKKASASTKLAKEIGDNLLQVAMNAQLVDNSGEVETLKRNIKGYDEEAIALKKSLKNKEIDRIAFNDKMKELDERRLADVRALEKAESVVWNSMRDTLTRAFAETANKYRTEMFNNFNIYTEKSRLIVQSNTTMNQLMEERDRAYSEGRTKDIAGIEARLQQSYDSSVENSKTAARISADAWSQAGAIIGLTTAQMIADNKSLTKSMVMGALAGAKAMIPIMTVQILGREFIEKSLFGSVTAGIMIGLLTAALSAAESGVANMKFRKGGYTGNLPENAEAGIVHGQEFVFNAQATRANDRAALEFANRTGKSIEEFYLDSPSFMNKIRKNKYKEMFEKEQIDSKISKRLIQKMMDQDRANVATQMQLNEQTQILKEIKQLTQEGNTKIKTQNNITVRGEFDTNRLVKLYHTNKMNTLARS